MPGVPPARYAYLGPAGTFAEQALRSLPTVTAATELLPCASVVTALEAVRDGGADSALVPFENSIEGSVSTTLDELAAGADLHITREVLLPVTFALLGRPDASLDRVRRVTTHPHAEAQCRRWLRTNLPQAQYVPSPSTAHAAELVADASSGFDAAIAAPIAAERYGLVPLATDIGDNPGAITRFVLVSRPAPPPPPTGADRTTLVLFERDDHPGALLEMLTEFAVRGVNLTRLESRPTGSGLGRYCFSVDCEGHVLEARVGEALAALRRICADVRFLGSYPRADGTPPALRHGTTDAEFADASAWLQALRDGSAR